MTDTPDAPPPPIPVAEQRTEPAEASPPPATPAPPPAAPAPQLPSAAAQPAAAPPAPAEPAPLPAGPDVPLAAASPAVRPLVRRHHWIVRATHWANAVLLFAMIASGLQIYGAFTHFGARGTRYFPNPFDGKPFPSAVRLGGWLAGGLNWHFALAWLFVGCGLFYLAYMLLSGEGKSLFFRPRDVPRAWQMQLYYLHLRREHPPQGKHNALQKGGYTGILVLGALSVLSGFAIYKPVQLSWLTALFGGYELARYWHFWAVFLFVLFTLGHVALVFLVDPASLRAMITGWYRGRFPSHD